MINRQKEEAKKWKLQAIPKQTKKKLQDQLKRIVMHRRESSQLSLESTTSIIKAKNNIKVENEPYLNQSWMR